MKRTVGVAVLAGVVVAGAGLWWWSTRPADDVAIDLVEAFRGAEKRSNLDVRLAFSMDPQTISGDTKPAIFMHPTSRVVYHDLVVPAHAQLRTFVALKEDAWDKGTDGVYFRIGVSTDGVYTDLFTRHLDPYRRPEDRGWVPVSIDLAAYAGKTVNLIFNTHSSPPGQGDHTMYDFAVFGAPVLLSVPPAS